MTCVDIVATFRKNISCFATRIIKHKQLPKQKNIKIVFDQNFDQNLQSDYS